MPMVFADGMDDAKILKDLQQTIAKVRTMSGPSMARTNAAEYLSRLTKEINPKKVDDKTLRDLVSLLNIPDDSVRLRVAGALGNLGPRAKMAVPALLRVIRETDCPPKIETGVTLSATALLALKRIGVEPPPPDCKEK
jgi:HEAT repeat protein